LLLKALIGGLEQEPLQKEMLLPRLHSGVLGVLGALWFHLGVVEAEGDGVASSADKDLVDKAVLIIE
jgi:hypothetical protein